MTFPWPSDDDWVWKGPLGAPATWGVPGVIMTFNLECAGCVSRGVPLLKRIGRQAGPGFKTALVHTSHGHRRVERGEVIASLIHFASSFARLEMPVAIDVDGELARAWRTEGTPHWLAFDAEGTLVRDLFGSQENAATRLSYLVDELLPASELARDGHAAPKRATPDGATPDGATS